MIKKYKLKKSIVEESLKEKESEFIEAVYFDGTNLDEARDLLTVPPYIEKDPLGFRNYTLEIARICLVFRDGQYIIKTPIGTGVCDKKKFESKFENINEK